MFQKKRYMSTEKVWFRRAVLEVGTPVDIRWGIRWAHIYVDGKKLGKIFRSAAKEKFTKI